MDFLQLDNKKILVLGVANRKSVAYHVGRVLTEVGAEVIYSVRDESVRESVARLLEPAPVYVCDVEKQTEIDALARDVVSGHGSLHGIVHSIAFADYSAGWRPFHETPREAFLQAVNISCFSLTAVANAFKGAIDPEQGSVVAMSISTTRMAAENYGYMAP
ncbi:MAG TPA: SDR family oxidoreductase, partial [Planctomycetaceae bacterium]|nr:SDR family oxidoreductase [Planctomycetaceae bacterium]